MIDVTFDVSCIVCRVSRFYLIFCLFLDMVTICGHRGGADLASSTDILLPLNVKIDVIGCRVEIEGFGALVVMLFMGLPSVISDL